jgi:hypothetical protein
MRQSCHYLSFSLKGKYSESIRAKNLNWLPNESTLYTLTFHSTDKGLSRDKAFQFLLNVGHIRSALLSTSREV